MNYKYCSIKRVIAKVLTDLDLAEENVRITDFISWSSEALLKIGGFPTLIIRTTGREDLPLIELTNYQAELPYDFNNLIQVSYSTSLTGPFQPMRYATGTAEHNPAEYNSTGTDSVTTVATSSLVTLAMQLYNYTYETALALINTDPTTRSILTALLASNTTANSIASTEVTSDYVYTIRGGYIKTNQETGYLMMSYQAIPTDIEGYPLIPDNESYIEAIYWYIVTKLYYPKWVLGQIRDAVYYEARRSYNFYCKQAYGNVMMPDRGQMESIKNSWLRLYPNINEFDTKFSHLGQQEFIYNHAT